MIKKTCGQYSSEEISRFVDNELPDDLQQEISRHILECKKCRAVADSFNLMREAFSRHADEQATRISPERVQEHLSAAVSKNQNHLSVKYFGLRGKPFYLTIASAVLILMISVFTFQNAFFQAPDPSAIVKSVDTDFASVMIIETQKEKHTIIWFTET